MKEIKNSFSKVIVGIIFIIIGVVLLWWNEGNNVKNIKTIEEAKELLVNVSSDVVDKNNEGKLVSTNGKLNVEDEYLIDSIFNVQALKTAKLVRVVEMYQWEEESKTENDKTTYTYERVWSTELIDSTFFNDKNRVNPETMPYEAEKYHANKVNVGAFELSLAQKEMLNAKQVVNLGENVVLPEGYTRQGNYISNSTNINSPAIGDVRISFLYNNDTEVSILAKQSGNTFSGYVSEQGKTLNEIMSGTLSGEEMIGKVEEENNLLKIVLRVMGILLLVFGFSSLLSPIATLTSFVPLVGKHISSFIGFIGALVGLCISLVVIAIAWIRFRPIVGISLLVGGALIIGLVVFLLSKSKKRAQEQPMSEVYTSSQVHQINNQFSGQEMSRDNITPQGATTLSSVVNESTVQPMNDVVQEQTNNNNNQNNNL